MGSVLDKNSSQVRKRIENHVFTDEEGEEYEQSEFNGFGDYFRRKKIKLQNLDAEMRSSSDKPQIFKGIVAHVTGYTQPPLHILHREIVQHGGGFLQYLDSKTMATHIIASTLPPKKAVDFHRYRIVKPAWIIDSIKAEKLLPWSDYRVLDEGPGQKVLKFDGNNGLTQISPQTKHSYHSQVSDSFYTSQLQKKSLPSQGLSQLAEMAQTPSLPAASSPARTSDPMEIDESPFKVPAIPIRKPIADDKAATTAVSEASNKAPSTSQSQAISESPQHATSEEHNAWLLSDPRLRKSSTANPDFLKQYYSESRLHHLSTWKAELKSKMQQLATDKGLAERKVKRKAGVRRYIMHVDFDSFFCAVSLKRYPEYVNKPVVVAHSAGSSSEIASCNYPAREFGVKNGMWMKRAMELCPDLKVIPYDFPAYEDASRLFYESILEIGGIVQSVSVDEALVDVTSIVLSAVDSEGTAVDEGSIWREQAKVDELATAMREKIKARTGCAVSVGIGGNILQAKVALRKAKPAGQYQLRPEEVLDMIGELQVENLPGVAYSIGNKLEEISIKFVKDIRNTSRERLVAVLGPKTGEKLSEYARGIDKTEVGEQPPRKSVSAEINWGIRFINQPEAEDFVMNLCKELEKRLVNEHVKGRQMTMKIMRRSLDAPLDPPKHLGHGKCDTFNKSTTFGVATHNYEILGKEAISILRSFKFSPGDLRGLGVQMTKLETIKTNLAPPEGSQKKLSFNAFARPSPVRKPSAVDFIDEIESPDKKRNHSSRFTEADPITDDPVTPRKAKVHPAMALSRAGQADAKANTPLNVSGTQFIMPTNPDPAIVVELPSNIRSKLMTSRSKQTTPSPASPFVRSRSNSPMPADPLPSQFDPEVFDALPDNMKAEVLTAYKRKPVQTVLPQSPHKDRFMQMKKPVTPTKRRGVGMFSKAQRQRDAEAGLVQTNFLDARPAELVEEVIEELDPEFLAELPEDVRKEIITDHRRRKLALQSRLDAPAKKRPAVSSEALLPGGQRRINFSVHPTKISFASSGIDSTQEIKDMIDAWHSETKREGPHARDVGVLERHLSRVIKEERDIEKAIKIVKWLNLVVDQDGEDGRGKQEWKKAVEGVKASVQRAVKQRGMPPLNI